jgi:hypothetical protein
MILSLLETNSQETLTHKYIIFNCQRANTYYLYYLTYIYIISYNRQVCNRHAVGRKLVGFLDRPFVVKFLFHDGGLMIQFGDSRQLTQACHFCGHLTTRVQLCYNIRSKYGTRPKFLKIGVLW